MADEPDGVRSQQSRPACYASARSPNRGMRARSHARPHAHGQSQIRVQAVSRETCTACPDTQLRRFRCASRRLVEPGPASGSAPPDARFHVKHRRHQASRRTARAERHVQQPVIRPHRHLPGTVTPGPSRRDRHAGTVTPGPSRPRRHPAALARTASTKASTSSGVVSNAVIQRTTLSLSFQV